MQDDDAATSGAASDSSPVEDARPSIGQQLREGREARTLTVEAAAASLHMDPSILRALESDHYSRLGAAVFVRGHMRRYASLLDLNADALVASFDQNCPEDVVPARAVQTRERFAVDDGLNWPIVVAVVAVVLLVVLAVWLLWDQPGEPTPVTMDTLPGNADQPLFSDEQVVLPEAQAVAGSPGDAAVAVDPSPGNPAMGASADQAQGESARVLAAPVPADATPVPGEALALVIDLQDECWTEITDAIGRRLYFGMGQPDQRIVVRGRPPISVLLGNASAARVEVDGRSWPMPDSNVSNNVARLRIEAAP